EKYAIPERERRFLLARIPDAPVVWIKRITDRYLPGTRLRIRQSVETLGDATTIIYKFTQKVPAPDDTPGLITTLYLTRAEYDALAAIPGRQLIKTRYSMPPLAVDVFDPPLHGLVLAEAEFASEETLQVFTPPSVAVAEVTRDVRFTGGVLAATTRDELLEALATFGIHPG